MDARPLGEGAAIRWSDGTAASLVERVGPRSLGGVLLWAARAQIASLRLVLDATPEIASRLARQAALFSLPIVVERIDGTATVAVDPAVPPAPVAVDSDAVALATALLAGSGVDVVVQHGVVRGEYLGLEIARVVTGPDGSPTLEVGVGRFDREISAMMFSNVPTGEAIAKAVELVRRHRRPGGPTHPLRDLVPERWLRRLVVDDPALVGAVSLEAADTTYDAPSLREAQPAAAVGTSTGGAPLVVVTTAGVDVDVVPLAADTRAALDPSADLVVCGPDRHLIDATRAVGSLVEPPVRFVAVELPY